MDVASVIRFFWLGPKQMEYYFKIMCEIKLEISFGVSCPHLSHVLNWVKC